MRWALFTVLVATVLGCGVKTEVPTPKPADAGGKADEAPVAKVEPKAKPKAERPPVEGEIGQRDSNYLRDYAENSIAADKRYKGKRFKISVLVADFGKRKDGSLWLSEEGLLGQTHNAYFNLAPDQEDALAKVQKRTTWQLIATCVGREDDGIWRGVQGYDFRVNFVDTEIVAPGK